MKQVLLSVILAVLLAVAGPVLAQDDQALDYQQWETLASNAEGLTDATDATEEQLIEARQSVADWRDEFQSAQGSNSGRIATVRDQISALGAAPAEGETEDEAIADRRAELNQQLAALQAPVLAADEALSRANSIIEGLNERLTDLEAEQVAKLFPSPLLPANLRAAATEGSELLRAIGSATLSLTQQSGGLSELGGRLPKVLGYIALAVLLLTFGRRWIERLPSVLSARASSYSRAVVAFFVSLGQIIIPMLGIFLGITGLLATEWFGQWTQPILFALPGAGVILFIGRWISRQLFPRQVIAYATLDIPDKRRAVARNSTNILAMIFAVQHVLANAVLPASVIYPENERAPRLPFDMSDGAATVIHFVLILLAAIFLFRLGNVLRGIMRWSSEDDTRVRNRVMAIAGMLSRVVAVGTVIVGAISFINVANGFMWSWLLTLALLGFLILAQDLIADIFNMLKRGEEGAREGLWPLIIGAILVVMSVPLFMAIWGASRAELAEMWRRMMAGATFGGITISPGGVISLILVFGIGYAITRALQRTLRNSVLPKTKIEAGGQNALVAGLGYLGIFIAAVVAISSAGINLSSLAIVASALSVGIGFGLQNIVSNFVAGIILLIERPISVGDWVDAGGQQGIVKRISVRSTAVETFDKTEVIVPNSDLVSQPVTNWTRSSRNGRVIIPVGVAYGTDTQKVDAILREIIEDQPTVMIDPAPVVLFRGLGADSMDFEIRAILSDVAGGINVTSDVLHEVVRRFAQEKIEIPYAQRDVWLRNPEVLAQASAGKRDKAERDDGPKTAQADDPKAPSTADKSDPSLTFDGDFDGDGGGDGDY
ncbi:mechanosensitive ion channel domain-containing protein [Paracoccus tegillarcae]|uniref:DUF3772 domain-containing protein n=1 Tax=Paracoccus tegillarcae TaxID=1529068 RepID=A0A2K9F0B6_9RHOB|nr:mechanosensitive ion channel domain-containing protein [Paracoccus tegillarcae]AUH35004.1 DUF3772 domain-containing protein [Paracoccus tegillarcae]